MSTTKSIPQKDFKKIPRVNNNLDVYWYIKNNTIDGRYLIYFKNESSFNDDTISEWLNLSVKTLRSYRQPRLSLKENLKEHLILLISLYNHGKKVFDTTKNFEVWLNSENFYFDNKSPKEFLDTVSGIKFIDDRLTAIEFGDNV